jgi:hypothetical protein
MEFITRGKSASFFSGTELTLMSALSENLETRVIRTFPVDSSSGAGGGEIQRCVMRTPSAVRGAILSFNFIQFVGFAQNPQQYGRVMISTGTLAYVRMKSER